MQLQVLLAIPHKRKRWQVSLEVPDSLDAHLKDLGWDGPRLDQVRGMIARSPARKVGASALTNTIVQLRSLKNEGLCLPLESRSVEHLYALTLELDPEVIAYRSQVPCDGIERHGGSHVSSCTMDFLEVRERGIQLTECKSRSSLIRLSEKKPLEWTNISGDFNNTAYAAWSAKHGFAFRVWAPPDRFAVYLANMEILYASYGRISKVPLGNRRALSVLKRKPMSLEELQDEAPDFSLAHAATLIAHRQLFGPIKELALTSPAFTFTLDSSQAAALEDELGRHARAYLGQPTSALFAASRTDFTKAGERLDMIRSAERLGTRLPRSLEGMAKEVRAAELAGHNPLEVCLSSYSKSGNRTPRLTIQQQRLIELVIQDVWLRGDAITVRDLHSDLIMRCTQSGVRPPSYNLLCRRVSQLQDNGLRALNIGGKRKYQSERGPSDPRVRTLPPLARGMKLVVDSTKLDVRTVLQLKDEAIYGCPTIYIAADAHTGEVMAHAVVYGFARRDGISILLRDFVRRHGFLPHQLQADRGSENRSKWLTGLCQAFGISQITPPSASSKTNGTAENLNGRVNRFLSHKLAGSTEPDKAGRKVDGKFKSEKTARLAFGAVADALQHLLYEHLPSNTDQWGTCPEELAEMSALRFPSMGIPASLDDNFYWSTAVPASTKRFDRGKGVVVKGLSYMSAELAQAVRVGRIHEIRSDPEDIDLVYVATDSGIIKAWTSNTSAAATLSVTDRAFRALYVANQRTLATKSRERAATQRRLATASINAQPQVQPIMLPSPSGVDLAHPILRIDPSDIEDI